MISFDASDIGADVSISRRARGRPRARRGYVRFADAACTMKRRHAEAPAFCARRAGAHVRRAHRPLPELSFFHIELASAYQLPLAHSATPSPIHIDIDIDASFTHAAARRLRVAAKCQKMKEEPA